MLLPTLPLMAGPMPRGLSGQAGLSGLGALWDHPRVQRCGRRRRHIFGDGFAVQVAMHDQRIVGRGDPHRVAVLHQAAGSDHIGLELPHRRAVLDIEQRDPVLGTLVQNPHLAGIVAQRQAVGLAVLGLVEDLDLVGGLASLDRRTGRQAGRMSRLGQCRKGGDAARRRGGRSSENLCVFNIVFPLRSNCLDIENPALRSGCRDWASPDGCRRHSETRVPLWNSSPCGSHEPGYEVIGRQHGAGLAVIFDQTGLAFLVAFGIVAGHLPDIAVGIEGHVVPSAAFPAVT